MRDGSCLFFGVLLLFVWGGVEGQGLLPQYRLVGLMPYTELSGEVEFVGLFSFLSFFSSPPLSHNKTLKREVKILGILRSNHRYQQ